MSVIGISALKQNASAVVADAEAGETIVITDRGRPVAQLTALPASPLQAMICAGRARPPRHDLAGLPKPTTRRRMSATLAELRDAERF